jgi:diguanylate cyclase (GGDEF)-like protein
VADESIKTALEVTLDPALLEWQRARAACQACVVMLTGGRIGQYVALSEAPLEIGRSSSCELQLDLDSVSRQHARIEWDSDAHVLVDNGSTNGTYVDDSRITRYRLRDGDRFAVGNALLKYLARGNIEAAYHAEIQHLAQYDALTNVVSKAHFTELFRKAVAKAIVVAQPVTLLMLDLDHFKRVNDDYGHRAGDAVLRKAAELAQAELESAQVLGRVGGEEFAVLCPGQDRSEGLALAERIRAAIEATQFMFEERLILVTISVGVATRAADSGEPPERLFERADARLYTAKASGRNCVR